MASNIEIRSATSVADLKEVYKLIRELAIHENSLSSFKIPEDSFIENASMASKSISALLAYNGERPVGAATFVKRFHIWNNTEIFELDDLYVSASERGKGIGTFLLSAIGQLAKENNMAVKWQVNPANKGAIALYKRLAASYTETGVCFWLPENINTQA